MTVNVTESQVLDTGAGARDRTGMDLMGPRDFKSLASANSATPAVLLYRGVTFYALCVLLCQCYIRVNLGSRLAARACCDA